MLEIKDNRITKHGDLHKATCSCGKESGFKSKSSAMRMLNRGSCRYCKRDYRSVVSEDLSIYQNKDGRWCSICSGCGTEQAYTRKDHAKQSEVADWQCRSCVQKSKGFSNNRPVGYDQRLYNKFKKSATSRGIDWEISKEFIFSKYNGLCSLTGWSIDFSSEKATASIDRIDSKKGYTEDNVQWVHTMVNMSKNKYSQDKFIDMCVSVAKNIKGGLQL